MIEAVIFEPSGTFRTSPLDRTPLPDKVISLHLVRAMGKRSDRESERGRNVREKQIFSARTFYRTGMQILCMR